MKKRVYFYWDLQGCIIHILSTKPFISFLRQYNVDYKLDTYLKIARLYLEDDDPVQAEAYINRASLLQNESSNEQLQIHYKVFCLHDNNNFYFPKDLF